jgi:predicted AlkP superfamily pyrophosphatase or phosphodiesterase
MDLDHDEHGSGPDSPAALKTLEEIDACIGTMRAAAREAGLERQTAWFIVSDHGFWPTQKALNPNAVLQSLGLAAPPGKPAEWRVASYGNGGSFALYARSAGDREAIDLATRTFTRLQAEGTWGIGKVLTRQDLDRAKALEGAFLAVSMGSGYSAGYGTGAWLTSYEKPGGNHGFWPGPPELDASFAAFGRQIGAARLPRGKLLDVAPTVARMLGFHLDGAEGRDLLVSNAAGKH